MAAVPVAAAALLLLMVMIQRPSFGPQATAPATHLAQVQISLGEVRVRSGEGAQASAISRGQRLTADQWITTGGDARLALQWRDGASVRIDKQTSLLLTAEGEIELEQGRVYLDTHLISPGPESPVILTPAGPVRHIGTQYMTSVDRAATHISVREGKVVLSDGGVDHTTEAGEQLSVDSVGHTSLEPIPVYGEPWLWAESLAAPFDSNGKSVADFLEWVSRETGYRVEYASEEAAQVARDTELRGEVNLQPTRALELVLQTTKLSGTVEGGIIMVKVRTEK